MVKNLPCKSGDTGWISSPGSSHVPRDNYSRAPQPWTCVLEPRGHSYWSPRALGPVSHRSRHLNKKPTGAANSSSFLRHVAFTCAQFSWRATSSPHISLNRTSPVFFFSSFISPISWQIRWKAREWSFSVRAWLTHLFRDQLTGSFSCQSAVKTH